MLLKGDEDVSGVIVTLLIDRSVESGSVKEVEEEKDDLG